MTPGLPAPTASREGSRAGKGKLRSARVGITRSTGEDLGAGGLRGDRVPTPPGKAGHGPEVSGIPRSRTRQGAHSARVRLTPAAVAIQGFRRLCAVTVPAARRQRGQKQSQEPHRTALPQRHAAALPARRAAWQPQPRHSGPSSGPGGGPILPPGCRARPGLAGPGAPRS